MSSLYTKTFAKWKQREQNKLRSCIKFLYQSYDLDSIAQTMTAAAPFSEKLNSILHLLKVSISLQHCTQSHVPGWTSKPCLFPFQIFLFAYSKVAASWFPFCCHHLFIRKTTNFLHWLSFFISYQLHVRQHDWKLAQNSNSLIHNDVKSGVGNLIFFSLFETYSNLYFYLSTPTMVESMKLKFFYLLN